MAKLFEESAQVVASSGRVVAVAVNGPMWRTFDYLWPDGLGVPVVGQRVSVPFGAGNRQTLAFVVDPDRRPGAGRAGAPSEAESREPEGKGKPPLKLKVVSKVIDAQSPFDESLWKLGEWISSYYLAPLGMTLAAMIPSAVGRHADRTEAVAYLTSAPDDWPSSLGARQKRVLDELFEARKQGVEPLTVEDLLHHSACSRDTLRRLSGRGLLRTEVRPVRLPELSEPPEGDLFDLNEDQRVVLAAVQKKLTGGFSVALLYGVTGSGKTEVYIRAIRRVIEAGRQAILLVPEIALATQTLQRLLKRLPRVAVLHSGLSAAQRAFYWQQIRDGHAAVVVGPRSALFSPAR
jgi:primosomal protein N' (replication factor Y)